MVSACDAYAWHEQSARRWRSRVERSPPFFPLLRVSVWLNKRVVVVLLCYRLAKPEQELVLRRDPFMVSERLGMVVPVFLSSQGSVRPGLGLVRVRCVCSVSRSGNAPPLHPLGVGTWWHSWRVRLARQAVNDVAHHRVHGGRMVVRWRGEAMMRRCGAVPSSYVAVADRGGAPGSDKVRFRSSFSVPPLPSFLFPPPFYHSWCGVLECHQWQRG